MLTYDDAREPNTSEKRQEQADAGFDEQADHSGVEPINPLAAYLGAMQVSKGTLTKRLRLHKLNDVLNNLNSSGQSTPEKIGHDTLRQLHDRMTQGERWQEDAALPEASAEQDFPVSAGQSLQNVLKDNLQQMALDILLETGLKLTGMDKRVAQTFVPVIKLIREARTVLSSGDGKFADRMKGLTEVLNTARNSLRLVCPDSVVFRGTDVLCDVADVLHKGLTSSDLSELKAPVEKLGAIPELASVVQIAAPLLELGGLLQQYNNNSITGQDLCRTLLDKVVPEGLMLPLKVGEKIAEGIQSGKLHVEGLPAWPGMTDKMACLQWLKTALTNDSFRGTLAAADRQWLTETLAFNAEEAEYAQTTLLEYVRPLASFPAQGTAVEQLMALKKMPGLSEMFNRADISLNDNLGAVGSLLKDNTTLSRLGGVVTATGATGKAWEALKLLDTGKSLTALKNITIEGLKKTFGVATDTVSAVWLVLKKVNDFRQSAYSAGQSLSDPVRFYRDVISFIKEDVKNNPDDYKNATVETLLATVAVALRSFGGNHVPVNWSGNTAEWLKAYAKADPAKLTAVDKVLMHAVLEPRAMLEISRAIQQEDTVQARKLLEPLSDALKSYAGDSPVLRQMAGVLPYIPAMNEAWKEIRAMELSERKALGKELRQQTDLLNDILHNSRKIVSSETLASRQKAVLTLQATLAVLQDKCGEGTGRAGALQVELDAMKVAVEALSEEKRIRLTEALNRAQAGLDYLKNPDALKGMPEVVVARMHAAQVSLHQNIRNTLVMEGVSPVTMMQAQLKIMTKTLDALPVELRLSDMGSAVHFATEALTQLATSKKPNLVSTRRELAALVTNAASDGLADVVRWSGNQMIKLFTREVELTQEEKALGIFVVERNLTVGQLTTGAAAGAASGALLSAMFLLLSGEGVPGLKKEQPGKMTMHRTTPEGATGPGGVNAESGQQIVRLSPPLADVYQTTTEPLSQESNSLNKWLMLALPVVAGAAAGAGVAAALKPVVREKYPEGMTVVNDPARAPVPGEDLYTYKDTDGVTKGIYLTDKMVEAARVTSAPPQEPPTEGAPLKLRRTKRMGFGPVFPIDQQKANERREREKKGKPVTVQKMQPKNDEEKRPNEQNDPFKNYVPDYKIHPITIDASLLKKKPERPPQQLPDHYYLPNSPERDVNFLKFNFKFNDAASNILDEYLKFIFLRYGKGLTHDQVSINDIRVRYKYGGNETIVTPKQMVTGQVDAILKARDGSILSLVNLPDSSKVYSFPSYYPIELQEKLKAGDFWPDVKAEMKVKLADAEAVSSYKSKIRNNVELSIVLNSEDNITQEELNSKINRCEPVQYKGRLVSGMFIVPQEDDPSRGRLYSINPQFKAVDIEFGADLTNFIDKNEALQKQIALGFTGSSEAKMELFVRGNRLNPNGIPRFHRWNGSHNRVEDFLFDNTKDKLYKDLDAITISDGEQAVLDALEIIKWGVAALSTPLGPKSAAMATLVSSLASTLQATVSEKPADAESYMQQALWEVAFAGLGVAAGNLLGGVTKNVLRKISSKIDDTIDAIKGSPTSLKQKLDNFKDFVSAEAEASKPRAIPPREYVDNGVKIWTYVDDLHTVQVYRARAQNYLDNVVTYQGKHIHTHMADHVTNGTIAANQVQKIIRDDPKGKSLIWVFTGTHGNPNGLRTYRGVYSTAGNRTNDSAVDFISEDVGWLKQFAPPYRNRIVIQDLTIFSRTPGNVKRLFDTVIGDGEHVVGAFCFSANDRELSGILRLPTVTSHAPSPHTSGPHMVDYVAGSPRLPMEWWMKPLKPYGQHTATGVETLEEILEEFCYQNERRTKSLVRTALNNKNPTLHDRYRIIGDWRYTNAGGVRLPQGYVVNLPS